MIFNQERKYEIRFRKSFNDVSRTSRLDVMASSVNHQTEERKISKEFQCFLFFALALTVWLGPVL